MPAKHLALMADRTVLGLVIVHGDFKHVVAANADAMDLRWRFVSRLGLGGMRGVRAMLWFVHARILT